MSEEMLSRRKFLAGAGAILGMSVIPAVLTNPAVAEAAATTQLPWPYKHLDAETLARRAYELYYNQGGCGEATWWPIVEALSADYPDTWGTLPKKMLAFGAGGINGTWGTLCGTCNGSAAIIRMTAAPTAIVDAVLTYYSETPIPTNGIDRAVRAGWVPMNDGKVKTPLVNAPTSTAHSPLCHASLTQWMDTTGSVEGGREQKDRCGKACYDMVLQTVTLLNAWIDSGATPVIAVDSSAAACTVDGCHDLDTPFVASKGKMSCGSCHDETPTHATTGS